MPRGFRHSYRADINRLNDLLQRCKYDSGLSIIKEIIQNTDDAEAETLHVGWTGGLAEADHPLLRGPAVFFINDRNLTVRDAQAVVEFNLSAKASESSTIGRFGIGLKSIFHLGEMFFYLSPPGLDFSNPGASPTDCLNPWHSDDGDGPHPDWSAFTPQDRGRIRQDLHELLTSPEWFCLYVPLRQADIQDPIVNSYVYSEAVPPLGLDDPERPVEIAMMLPMLRWLRSVNAWRVGGAGDPPERLFGVELETAYRRTRLGRDDEAQGRHEFEGAVKIITDATATRIQYSGVECQEWSDCTRALRDRPQWPTREVIGERAAEPVECYPHAAVYLALLEADPQPKFTLQQASFLPLSKTKWQQDMPPGTRNVQAVFHGYYFVDPDRQSIELPNAERKTEDAEETIRCEWNRRIQCDILLPLIPQALDCFMRDGNADDGQVEAVTRAVQNSEICAEHREHVCARHQWARTLTPEGPRWQLLDAGISLVSIPSPSDTTALTDLLTTLIAAGEQTPIVFKDDPRLTTADSVSPLSVEQLCLLLRELDGECDPTPEQVSYLAELVKSSARGKHHEDVDDALRPILRQWIAGAVADSNLEAELQESLADLVNHVAPERRISLALSKLDRAWAAELVNIAEDVLVLPATFTPREPSCAALAESDAERLLRCIGARTAEAPDAELRAMCSLITQIGKAYDEKHDAGALGLCPDVPLIYASIFEGNQERRRWLTLDQAREAARQGRVFANSEQDVAQALAGAVDGVQLVSVAQELARSLKGDDEQVSAAQAAAQYLGQWPALAPAGARVDLLSRLLSSPDNDRSPHVLSAVRYLLHGSADAEQPQPLPLLQGPAGGGGVWNAIADKAVQDGGAVWAERSLVGKVAPELWEALDLHTVDSTHGSWLIEIVGPEAISGEDLDDEQRRQLLLGCDDEGLLRQMRIHRTLNGDWVSIGDGSYWQGGFSPRATLPPGITLLEQDDYEVVRARQKLLTSELDLEIAILEALAQDEPGRYWRLIWEAWKQLDNPKNELRRRMREVRWLPTRDGPCVAPNTVLRHSELNEQQLARVAALSADHVSVHQLHDGLCLEALQDSRGLLMRDADCLKRMAELLAQKTEYRFGALSVEQTDGARDSDGIVPEALREAFGDGPGGLDFSCHIMSLATEARADEVVRCFCQEVPADRLLELLGKVQARCQERSTAARPDKLLWPLMIRYLELALASDLRRRLRQLHLPNRRGKWCPVNELCVGAPGVAEHQCVHKDLAPLFGQRSAASQHVSGAVTGTSEDAAAVLGRYFRGWEAHVEPELIGALLGVIGDDEGIVKLARSYLRDRSLEWLRSHLRTDNRACNLDKTLERQRVRVRVQDTDRIQVESLVGEMFTATYEGHDEHLLVVSERDLKDTHVSALILQRIALDELDPERARRLLKRSVEVVLETVYPSGYKMSVDDQLWDELLRSDQSSVRFVRERIISALPRDRSQIGLSRNTALGTLLSDLDAVAREFQEVHEQFDAAGANAETQFESRRNDLEKRLEERYNALTRQLRAALDDDAQVHDELLTAVKQSLEDYQYDKSDCVPFELLQNADDAVVELEFMTSEAADVTSREFVVGTVDETLWFAHCGRRINQFGWGDKSYRDRGFDADLEKMLALTGSDKNPDDENLRVTGRFGLGFKSVFQVTTRPRIVSGRLAVEVVGGYWPKMLPDEHLERLRGYRDELGSNATVIELPLAAPDDGQILAEFRRLLPMQLAFTQRIKSCRFPGQTPAVIRWEPTDVADVAGVETARFGYGEGIVERAMLLCPPEAKGAVLLALGPRGFERLGEDVPTIWCTTPMRDAPCLGIALNGKFKVGVGRAQVAAGTDNEHVAQSVAEGVGVLLCRLHGVLEHPGQWDLCRQQLGFAQNVSQDEFWQSLWAVATEPFSVRAEASEGVGANLLRIALWGSSDGRLSGLGRLYDDTCTIPSGLPAGHAGPVCLSKLKWAVSESLADEQTLRSVENWQHMKDAAPPGTAIAREHYRLLKSAMSHLPIEVKRLSLCRLLEWELEHVKFRVSPGLAARLGAVFTRARVDELPDDEAEKVRKLLGDVMFRNSTEHFAIAAELVAGENRGDDDHRHTTDRDDETARSRFAPAEAVLHGDYEGAGLSFFLACRQRLEAGAEKLATWIEQASPHQRGAALKYLVEGQLRSEVAEHLCRRGVVGKWFDPLGPEGSRIVGSMPRHERLLLYGILKRSPPQYDEPREPIITQAPPDSVERIAQWWKAESGKYRERYLNEVWGGDPPRLSLDASMRELPVRCEWMRLFLMGMCHSMGRTQPTQHRSFLDDFRRKGWLDTISRSDAQPGEWERLLDEYIDQPDSNRSFYHWMRQFVGMRWLSRHLDDYVQRIRELNRDPNPTPNLVTDQRSSSALQGTGGAPPSLDHVLGMGQYFVFRELARMKIVHNSAFYPHCFFPRDAVRKLVFSLGCSISMDDWRGASRPIHEFFHDRLGDEGAAIFDGDFDIPLQCLCRWPELQSRVGLAVDVELDPDDEDGW